jgi:hypothetical protein
MKAKWFTSLLIVMILFIAVGPVGAAGAGRIRDVSPEQDSPDLKPLPFDRADVRNANPPLGPAQIGQTKTWLGIDDFRGVLNIKNYVLRGVGTHVEVWVNPDLRFPNPQMRNPLTSDPNDFFTYNDCRNLDPSRITITDAQVQYLIDQFDHNMYPIEADWWSVAPKRDGNKNVLAKQLGAPKSYYKGEGDNIVVLIDNVRDENFYDKDNAGTHSYIAGFYSSQFDNFVDRLVMSVDAWDWIHRTTADPAHNPTTDPCTSSPARPYLYEGVFAHEYQHLLHHYTDADEVNWVNEGLSDFTEVITGYADLSKHVDEKGHEGHTQTYLGWKNVFQPDWNPIPEEAGPENGLTAWGDQGDGEILADYGNAMFFMNYLHSQPGLDKAFFTAWQHNPGNGIDGLNAALTATGSSSDFNSLFEDDLIAALADGFIDNGASVTGGSAGQFSNGATEATVNIDAQANSTHGAPPWGADYIDLGSGGALTSVAFNGDDQFVFPAGPQWVVDGDGYFTNPDNADGLYENEQDISIARSVAGHDGQVLSFDHYYAMELGWDFGFVQVSTDGGTSWQSLACTGTTSNHNPSAFAHIVAELPGFTGPSDDTAVTSTIGTAAAPVHVTCPALPAGTTHLAFRLMTDEAAQFDGWHVKNIQLNGVALGTPGDLTGWDNQAFFNPEELTFGFAVVGINGTVDTFGDVTAGGSVVVIRSTLGSGQEYSLSPSELSSLSGSDRVVALVWGVPGAELSTLYQPYSLLVNGVERADGQ